MVLVPSFESLAAQQWEIDWTNLTGLVVVLVVVTILVERSLAVPFESGLFANLKRRRPKLEIAARISYLLAGSLVCIWWRIDALSVVTGLQQATLGGCILTGATVAGMTNVSAALFRINHAGLHPGREGEGS